MDFKIEEIILMHNIIDAVVSRGAIKAKEMLLVGGLYQKLSEILAAARKTAESNSARPSTNTPSTPFAPSTAESNGKAARAFPPPSASYNMPSSGFSSSLSPASSLSTASIEEI